MKKDLKKHKGPGGERVLTCWDLEVGWYGHEEGGKKVLKSRSQVRVSRRGIHSRGAVT